MHASSFATLKQAIDGSRYKHADSSQITINVLIKLALILFALLCVGIPCFALCCLALPCFALICLALFRVALLWFDFALFC
jgi:hypothetical protein